MPHSNSEPAKLARVAAAMHLLANHLNSVVFQPCHIPNSHNQSTAIDHILGNQVFADPRAALMMRGLLLSMYTREEFSDQVQKNAHRGKDALLEKLCFMTSDGGITFAGKLDGILNEAADLWAGFQYVQQTIEAVGVNEQALSGWTWCYDEEFGQPPQEPQQDLLDMFPGFWVLESSTELYKGHALWKGQEHINAAHIELQKSRPRGFGFAANIKAPPGGRHRRSVSSSGGTFVPIPSPTSPTISRMSGFSDRSGFGMNGSRG